MAQTDAMARAMALTGRRRRWPELRGGRHSLGLMLGPIAVTAILAVLASLDADTTGHEIALGAVGLLIAGISWSLIAGWVYLLVVTRRRGRIARAECLLLGILISGLWPVACVLLVYGISGANGVSAMLGKMTHLDMVVFTVMLSLFGLLAGWLFWRFGVRPAKAPEPDLTGVFD